MVFPTSCWPESPTLHQNSSSHRFAVLILPDFTEQRGNRVGDPSGMEVEVLERQTAYAS